MKKIIKNKFLTVGSLLYIVLFIVSGCAAGVKNGDLLFVTAKDSGLSGAINNVTQKEKNASFDHIGIVEKIKRNYYVLHASPKRGSDKQKLKDFIQDQKNDGQNIVVYRLKPEYQSVIPEAITKGNLMLGKPYNFNYILNEDSYYCSDFIERIFRKDHIFTLEPMTFIDPKTGKTNEFWQKFYQEKNLNVPEGELGCNPNGLAASSKILRIKELR
ncbi:YiiX/YebB-like N1pC/P60 family cysteine hydrolase [Chryseobacterium camelliae]|uniref:YiiX/YebB-like N1pC/P60 family cysteine hydrolase n=1 Tax=Chryseobacterium camelliae TaxID=1265445 RepID=A0ABY7QSF7_9FLAO|nr:YiiX/YebB-like N1pC/P60 family cysteine hydrolase [Chryseobacterium camelliae]WBV61691.1 YiiX/YebB-like N1pC/P60 family cysteine hydrolase [Chryseobacterium camelliae]